MTDRSILSIMHLDCHNRRYFMILVPVEPSAIRTCGGELFEGLKIAQLNLPWSCYTNPRWLYKTERLVRHVHVLRIVSLQNLI